VRFNGNQDEGRLKWGDRGVAVGHLWEPSTSPSRLPEPQYTNPAWLEKSLGPGGEADSNVIYGRKVYIEPAEMEEREQKRKRALENQKAIRQQVMEKKTQPKLIFNILKIVSNKAKFVAGRKRASEKR